MVRAIWFLLLMACGGGGGGGGGGDGGPADATGDASLERVKLADAEDPHGVALFGDDVYFTTESGTLHRVSKQGGEVATLVDEPGVKFEGLVVTDAAIYFWGGPDIKAVARSGGTAQVLAPTGRLAGHGVGYPQLVLDGDTIYWGGDLAVYRVSTAGGDATAIHQAGAAQVAVDATHVYWIDDEANVFRTAKGSGTPGTMIVTAGSTRGGGLYADAAGLVWFEMDEISSTESSRIRMAAADGSAQALVIARAGFFRRGTLVDGDTIYFTTSSAILRLRREPGAAVETVAASQGAYGMAVDATHLYWAESAGGIFRIGK